MDSLIGRVLALDPGSSKIGLAISDPTRTLAREFAVWPFDKSFWGKLSDLISEQKISLLLIGLPIGLKGDTDQTLWVNDFVKVAQSKISIPLQTAPELFTSKIAQQERQHLKKSSRQTADDAAAARVLLQTFLDCQPK